MFRYKQNVINYFFETHPYFLIGFISFVLICPQLVSQCMIVGSDSIFHFNRFYDTSMQIKEGNFNYYISMYGFGQTARIVNALYSPYLAYIFGGLLLAVGSWFKFQLVSNFFLYMIAGSSMYIFLRKLLIRKWIAVGTALVYLSTFAVQYWVTRQGFSSWGAAILPLCLIPVTKMTKEYDVNVLQLGCLTALMMQVHFLTAMFLVMIYVPFFLYALKHSSSRWNLMFKLFSSIGVFIFFTLNLWVSLFQLYTHNSLLSPFINYNMGEATITFSSFYCLIAPFFLLV